MPSFTVNGNEITDAITGLVWQKDYGPEAEWPDVDAYCTGLGTNWRVPSRLEVISLLDHGAGYAVPVEFDAIPGINANVWTATEDAKNPSGQAWVVSESNGNFGTWGKTGSLSKFRARCVKGPLLTAAPFALDAPCGVVTSISTGLMWERAPENAKYSWSGALAHCESLSFAGFDDWRVPTAKELSTIVDDQADSPAISEAVFGTTPPEPYWTSTPYQPKPSEARFINFADGSGYLFVAPSKPFSETYRARCVRNLP